MNDVGSASLLLLRWSESMSRSLYGQSQQAELAKGEIHELKQAREDILQQNLFLHFALLNGAVFLF